MERLFLILLSGCMLASGCYEASPPSAEDAGMNSEVDSSSEVPFCTSTVFNQCLPQMQLQIPSADGPSPPMFAFAAGDISSTSYGAGIQFREEPMDLPLSGTVTDPEGEFFANLASFDFGAGTEKPIAETATYRFKRLGNEVIEAEVSMTFPEGTFDDVNEGALKSKDREFTFLVRDKVEFFCPHSDSVCRPYSAWLQGTD